LLIIGWLALFATAYKVAHLQHDYVNYDPFEILGIDPSSSSKDIKKAYHKLSLIYHPDKETGDEKKFLLISKAYAALTDEEARKNWETYGNPDGPGATSFGIALPAWIVEKENSILVLGAYALVFMIALPTIVGIWWYNSVKYGGDEVLLDTTQLYYFLIHKTPHMMLKRVIMIIAASPEFEKSHNSEVAERPTDNQEVPQLIRELPNLNEKNRERPLCFAYSIKARALLYAHLSRMELPPDTLDIDRAYIIKKCPILIQEFVQCVAQLTMLAVAGRISKNHCPSLETLEAAMKLSPLIVQALWDSKSPLLQLPHITEDNLRYFTTKKRNIRNISSFAQMRNEERRDMLRSLSNDQYEDILIVLGNMPLLDVETATEVLDDEESGNITAGAIVTVTVTLTRKPMSTLFDETELPVKPITSSAREDKENMTGNGDVHEKRSLWEPKKSRGKGKKKKQAQKKQKVTETQSPADTQPLAQVAVNADNHTEAVPAKTKRPADDSDEGSDSGEESCPDLVSDQESVHSYSGSDENATASDQDHENDDDDEEDWQKFQRKSAKKSKELEAKPRMSHPVHCPFFSDDKQEYWWIYLADKKRQALTSIPVLMTNLVDKEQVELKLTAPTKPGLYQYHVIVRSDSYVDFDVVKMIKVSEFLLILIQVTFCVSSFEIHSRVSRFPNRPLCFQFCCCSWT
jgi:translocation protein SEC63